MVEHTKITALDNGPYLVRGPVVLLDAEGNEFRRSEQSTVALCRCGGSTTKPFCDGTHSKIGFRAAQRAVREEGGRVIPTVALRYDVHDYESEGTDGAPGTVGAGSGRAVDGIRRSRRERAVQVIHDSPVHGAHTFLAQSLRPLGRLRCLAGSREREYRGHVRMPERLTPSKRSNVRLIQEVIPNNLSVH